MKIREFNKILNSCRDKKKHLSIDLINKLSEETKHSLALFIIRNRDPVILEFITPLMDTSWLSSMGYLYRQKGKNFIFICTAENQHKVT